MIYIILMALLGIPVDGWADGLPTSSCALADFGGGATVPIACDSQLLKRVGHETVCYRRMREAMQLIDPYLIDRDTPPSWPPLWWNDNKDVAKNRKAIDQWEKTMGACVR
jgi:hypothetical protein